MSNLWVWEGVNLFAGDTPPNNSKHLTLSSVKLPDLNELTQDHHAGGAIGQIEIAGMGIAKPMVTFKQAGWDPQTMSLFGRTGTNQDPYTIYGLLRDKNGNKPIEMKAIVRGRINKITPADYSRGSLFTHDYGIGEILHYELYLNFLEQYYWDFFASIYRIAGVDQNTDELNILRIPSA